jgi:hypothetical protein
MSLVKERHVGKYRDHTIEVVEDGLAKRVTLLVDGRELASESCVLPQEITLTGTLGEAQLAAAVTVRFLASSRVTATVDGTPIELVKTG